MDFDQRKRLLRQGFWMIFGPLGGFLIVGVVVPSLRHPTGTIVALVYFLLAAVSILLGLVRLQRSRDHRLSDALAIGAVITSVIGIALLVLFLFGVMNSARVLSRR